jgi:hypothetical protein
MRLGSFALCSAVSGYQEIARLESVAQDGKTVKCICNMVFASLVLFPFPLAVPLADQ